MRFSVTNLFHKLLDATILFSFDRTGFRRHCREPLEIKSLEGTNAIVTGASSGIGLQVAKTLVERSANCLLIARHIDSIALDNEKNVYQPSLRKLDMSSLKEVYAFASQEVKEPLHLIVHNAGGMPNNLSITTEGYEQMWASQVLAPFIMTKVLADQGKLAPECRIIFVSSGGMYLQKIDLSDLNFQKATYNKYIGYANSKRAQIMLCELFSIYYPSYLFSAMHPGWVDTPGVQHSMPLFAKFIGDRLRTPQEGADTVLWLATADKYPTGKFWFDRQMASTTLCGFRKPKEEDYDKLWNLCLKTLDCISSKAATHG